MEQEDLSLASQSFSGGWPWQDEDDPRLRSSILWAAHVLQRTPADIAARYAALGYRVPDPASLPEQAEVGDLGRTPAEINDRRGELGHRSPALPEVDRFDDEDIILLSQDVGLRGPWLDPDTVVPVKHVLRAARAAGRSPQAVAERLTRLGHPVHVSPAVSVDDNDLLETLPPFGGAVPVEHILDMVNRTGMSPAQVVARLSVLNCPVPDLDYPTSRPAATPERQNPHPQ
ncbi:hypothetical protein ACFYXC_20480 [Streptomyces sp. NPDC002701]|uniref:wHTH domain-containing protein n=1 Tax=Streptomyces sp. NPDC002701 TaxID=3364661 RepID=UPI0036CA2943